MEISFSNGQIIGGGYFYEEVPYDVCANDLSVRFDGKGAITKYISCKSGKNFVEQSYLNIYTEKSKLNSFTIKKVEMIGKMQKITLFGEEFSAIITQFVSDNANAVFCEVELKSTKKNSFTLVYDVGNFGYIPILVSNIKTKWIEDNLSYYITCPNTKSSDIKFVLSYDSDKNTCKSLLKKFDKEKESVLKQNSLIKIPKSAKTEMDKALYTSAINCCLQNYKDLGEFKAFMAGCNYVNPMRTYYRDSYWTTLSMYEHNINLVKNQIRTLARGIAEDGTCPSAVKVDFSAFWGNHYDSPSFFVMMVYDYVNHSNDVEFLNEKFGDKTLLNKCVSVVDKLYESVDKTGLIYKKGPLNKRDWADAVNRNGYVTYNQALYYRALKCLALLLKSQGKDGSKYLRKAEKLKKAVNDILWSEKKGYFVNYKYGDFVEDNLSVDTVITYLFGMVEDDRAKKMLDNMERVLETKNNKNQRAGDYGVMCVFPFYKEAKSTFSRSSQDYNYHNGANWPYLSCLYAYAKYLAGREYKYALSSWFKINVKKGNYTPVEYFSPCTKTGSMQQAWSGMAAFVYDQIGKKSFFEPINIK